MELAREKTLIAGTPGDCFASARHRQGPSQWQLVISPELPNLYSARFHTYKGWGEVPLLQTLVDWPDPPQFFGEDYLPETQSLPLHRQNFRRL